MGSFARASSLIRAQTADMHKMILQAAAELSREYERAYDLHIR